METLANFFESINKFLGVSTPMELVFHPVFMGVMIVLFLYALFTGMKYFAITVGGLMGGAAVIHYLYPQQASDLGGLIKFVGAMGALGLVLLYIGFIRD
ncbi:MAG: hypothetical protein HY912_21610 [Desulfomonile tiedjei]|uniref:Uncharacterized protein n=1 Tax=Desulfomonile tiedjei TaxID=2358 RepID=A0A9D6V8X4_9BACT|nr:hypothetical protein [Desulfomonile tiedjei]